MTKTFGSDIKVQENLSELAGVLIEAANSCDADYDPNFLFISRSRTDGWTAEFTSGNEFVMTMTQWGEGEDVKKIYNDIRAGDESAAVEEAGDILYGWDDEWDDE